MKSLKTVGIKSCVIKLQISQQHSPCTLQALGAGIVHTPADQSHRQPQKNQKYPVLAHLGHYVPPHTSKTIWDREIKLMIHLLESIHHLI